MKMPLFQRYQATQQQNPTMQACDIAQMLNVSEAELVYARVGNDAQHLNIDASTLLTELEKVGRTCSVTANHYARHALMGEYQNLRLHGHLGLVLNPRALDLRLFFSHWNTVFSLRETTPQGEQLSIQCFDFQGNSIHKIYCSNETNINAWHTLVAQFHTSTHSPLILQPAPVEPYTESPINNATIDAEWRKMNDIHQFFMLLKRNKITRRQAFRAVSDDLAYRVDNSALMQIVKAAQNNQNEIMLFVGNNGCMQIFTGVIEQFIISQDENPSGNYDIQVLSQGFHLQINASAIAESWVTRKPTKEGFVSSLELLDSQGKHILQVFGQRSEGQPEQNQWHQQLAQLTASGSLND
ncbi:hemin-degrading factor [Yersinia vastinensis]|uniref:hemin-degrading factor n=1 Tax=Yersinia vastinensis TaxID=2890318 RepID=UPI0011A44504|nr:ChuX/HutX family heme-like substrate-binding protein [Yersinia vastinensis]